MGVSIQRIHQINGNSEFCQEYFTDVELTDDDVIGGVNDGWTVTQTMLLHERGAGVHRADASPQPKTGIARDVLELAQSVGALRPRTPPVRSLEYRVFWRSQDARAARSTQRP